MRTGPDFRQLDIVDAEPFGLSMTLNSRNDYPGHTQNMGNYAHPLYSQMSGDDGMGFDLWGKITDITGDIYEKGQEALEKEIQKVKTQAIASGAQIVGSGAQALLERPEVKAAALERGKTAALEATAKALREKSEQAAQFVKETVATMKAQKGYVILGAVGLTTLFVIWRIKRKRKIRRARK